MTEFYLAQFAPVILRTSPHDRVDHRYSYVVLPNTSHLPIWLEVMFDLDPTTFVEHTDTINELVTTMRADAEFAGSGAGFGARDVEFILPDGGNIDQLVAALKALNIPGLEVIAYTQEEEDDILA